MHSSQVLSQLSIQHLKERGINQIIISPGSRNAPLTLGFTNDDFFKCYSIVDERCAAFFALGIAQETKKPSVLVCTSGSALLNYYPAVSEAYYSEIPLIILSADRPKEFVNVGDGQTINQLNAYGSHVLKSVSLIENEVEENNNFLNEAINCSVNNSGPVHINIPFYEPLYNLIEEPTVKASIKIEDVKLTNFQLTKEMIELWNSSKRKLILVGVNDPNEINEEVIDLISKDSTVLVLTETTSNLHHENFVNKIDTLISVFEDPDFKDFQPDLLITLGGLVISKKIKALLRNYSPKSHWHIGKNRANDTFFKLENHLQIDSNLFFKTIYSKSLKLDSIYQRKWLSVISNRNEKQDIYLKDIPFSDLKAFDKIAKSLPSDINFQVSNSSAIRYTQLFNIDRTINVYCNRGTSGIDGSTSTAIGMASQTSKQTVFVTGDLSFFYDSNALWNNYIPNNFRIIVLNNNGGGIFRILPGDKSTQIFEDFLETKHNLTAEHLCKMYGFEYDVVDDLKGLNQSLNEFYTESSSPKLLEIQTPSNINDKVLLSYFKATK